MIKKELEYNFHDSVVVSCNMEKSDRMKMEVMLYDFSSQTKNYVSLTFSGIFNSEKVNAHIEELTTNSFEPTWNGTRIDDLSYHREKVSKERDQTLVLSVDGYEPLAIHCKKLRIEKIATP